MAPDQSRASLGSFLELSDAGKLRLSVGEHGPRALVSELDLLQRLMEFDPSKRITAQEGVKHPYCVQFHDAAHEPVAAEKVSIMIDDNEKKSTSVYREKLYSEVMPRFKENAKRKDGKAR